MFYNSDCVTVFSDMILCSFVDCLDCVCGHILKQRDASFTYKSFSMYVIVVII